MKANITTEIGNIYYSEDVIANIAGLHYGMLRSCGYGFEEC